MYTLRLVSFFAALLAGICSTPVLAADWTYEERSDAQGGDCFKVQEHSRA